MLEADEIQSRASPNGEVVAGALCLEMSSLLGRRARRINRPEREDVGSENQGGRKATPLELPLLDFERPKKNVSPRNKSRAHMAFTSNIKNLLSMPRNEHSLS